MAGDREEVGDSGRWELHIAAVYAVESINGFTTNFQRI